MSVIVSEIFNSRNGFSDWKPALTMSFFSKLFSFEKDKLDCSAYNDLVNTLGWDGKFEGKDVPIGSYVWRLSYKRSGNQRIYDKDGVINIIK